jgi:hypothetical protein
MREADGLYSQNGFVMSTILHFGLAALSYFISNIFHKSFSALLMLLSRLRAAVGFIRQYR